MVSGVVTTVLNTAILAIAYPLYLYFLGYEQYGLWLVLSAVLTFAQLGNLGINQAVMKLVAEEYGRGDLKAVQGIVSSATAILILAGMSTLALILLFRSEIIQLLRLSESDARVVSRLLPYVGCLSIYVYLVQTVNAVLAGLGRMDLANYTQTAGRCIMVAIGGGLLLLSRGLASLLIANVLSYIVVHVTSVILIRRMTPIHVFRMGSCSLRHIRQLVHFGSGILGGAAVALLMNPFNKLLLSRYAGIATVPVYEIALQVSMQMRALIEAGLRSLVPEVSRIGARDSRASRDRIAGLHRKAVMTAFLIGAPIYTVSIIFSPVLFTIWLGDGHPDRLPVVFQIMAVGGFTSLIAVPAFYTLMGLGCVRSCFWGLAVPAICNVIWCVLCVLLYGDLRIEQVAYSFVVGTGLSSLYLLWTNSRIISAGQSPMSSDTGALIAREGRERMPVSPR